MRNKELWFQARLLSNKLREDHSISDGGVVCVSISPNTTTHQLKHQVYRKLNLDRIAEEEKIVFKLRHFNGALIPFSNQLESNDSSSPFILEVVDVHQNIKATEWQVPELHRKNLTSQIDTLCYRVEDLEQKMGGISDTYAKKLNDELKLLSTQTAVLKRLVTESKDD